MPTVHVLLGYLGVATILLLCFLAWKTCTIQKSSWNVTEGIKPTVDVGPVLDNTFKRHHYRKKREQNIEQPKIEKNVSSSIRIKCF